MRIIWNIVYYSRPTTVYCFRLVKMRMFPNVVLLSARRRRRQSIDDDAEIVIEFSLIN